MLRGFGLVHLLHSLALQLVVGLNFNFCKSFHLCLRGCGCVRMSWAPKQPQLGITALGGPKVAAVRSLPCPVRRALRLIICQGTANRGSQDKKKAKTKVKMNQGREKRN